jgi:hypothetical protein
MGNFYKALMLVNNSNPTGVNADNKLSMAIAIHTVTEVNRIDYNYRDYKHYKWVNYLAWKVLRYSPIYRPPSPPSTINNEHDNTSPPAMNSVSTAEESPFPPDSATTNAAIMQITTNQNPSPAAVTDASATNISFSTVATSSAAVGDNNLSLAASSSKKRAFLPADPALGGCGAEMGAKKAKKEHDKNRAEELKEKRFNELKSELR